jgi:hypothetical protein
MKKNKLSILLISLFVVISILPVNAQNSKTKQINLVRLSPGGTHGNENLIGQVNRQGLLSSRIQNGSKKIIPTINLMPIFWKR